MNEARTRSRDPRGRDTNTPPERNAYNDHPTNNNGGGDTTPTAPAHDLHAEQAVIGGMLLSTETADQVAAILAPGDFYHTRHATIFKAIIELGGRGEPTDPIAVSAQLAATGELGRVGGGAYLHTCLATIPTAANATYYAGIVADQAKLRLVGLIGDKFATVSRTADPNRLDDLFTWARDQIDRAAATTTATTDTWAPVDLTPALTGGTLTTPPCLLARSDGQHLLYPGRLHSLSGEPESGKTWMALEAVYQAIAIDTHVIYLDFEDTPEGITGRLLAMGAHPDQIRERLHYVRPDRPIDGAARKHISTLIADHLVALTVIDGVTEAMTLHGLDPYNNPDAAKFYEALPRFVTRHDMPPAVLLIDHVPKDEDRPKRYAIGAQHKLAGLDGAAFVVDIVKPFAPGQPGFSRIRVAKDRPGQVRKNALGGVVAELHVDGQGEVVKVSLSAPDAGRSGGGSVGGSWRPTILMERVSLYVEMHPGLTSNAVVMGVKGKAEHVRNALELLVSDGYLRTEPGANRAIHHHHVKPFRVEVEDHDD